MIDFNQIKHQQGLTLVELMVAMVLSLFLIAGVMQVYLSNTQAYRMTEASSRVQENARFAFRFLTKDIRMAGYQGCAGQAMTVTNTLNGNASFLYDFEVALEGFEAGGNEWSPSINAAITNPLAGSDIIVIRGMFGSGAEITGQPSNSADCNNYSSYTAVLKISNANSLSDGDIVIAGNCTRASIFQITQINNGGNIVHNTGGARSPGNSTKDLAACYAGNGQLQKITTTAFYIRNNPANIPSLYRKDISNAAAVAQELVEGVESMDITYGIGSGVNNVVEQFVTADAVGDWDKIISVRINLLLRSIQNNMTTASQKYTFNGNSDGVPDALNVSTAAAAAADPEDVDAAAAAAAAANGFVATDRRLHRVFTTTIALRNRLK